MFTSSARYSTLTQHVARALAEEIHRGLFKDALPPERWTESRLTDGVPIYGDEIARVVKWKYQPGLGSVAGQPVRPRFVMEDADLFSQLFRPNP